ncbi:DNA phosphorothioation-associated putative methyltransferase [Oscillatoria salina]|uniref:DNA phosphorothioation-associated putative methyltransferase n=1 Tax=Oscillatoria salina TaxID=331517 RepID=UPI001CCF565F|nr:DNA phosphorothioation-associated putative methyltransferase [Oscillatoria salina]MBZ8180987.1 DNA phosphorothioation-associated putative methyltransferase [Oscillatoria salina IIICB1]
MTSTATSVNSDDALNLEDLAALCQASKIGKLLPAALYVHTSAISALHPELQAYEIRARNVADAREEANLVKFSTDKLKISYLFYPDFDTDPHPALQASIQVNLQTLEVGYRDYRTSENPPILHRKETFVTPEYPLYAEFAELTRQEVALGLLDDSRFIGTREEWQQRLYRYRLELCGHRLVCAIDAAPGKIIIERHKAAIARTQLSRPVRLALEADLFPPDSTFFDYGCGHGGDIQRIAEKGNISSGWDPYYRPDAPRTEADIVNIGYVINVIEDPAERREALISAWNLTKKLLIVAAQVLIDDRQRGVVAYGDGVITSRNTFQKYYEQEELKIYIDQVLNVDAIPAGLGIYFIFRDENQAEAFRASRFHSRATTPRIKTPNKSFADYQELLTPLMNFVTKRGRLPVKGELAEEAEIKAEFRSFRRAFDVILQVTDEAEWSEIAEKRRQDLKLYLALASFTKRPKPRSLNPEVKEDFKALFGNYKRACLLADMMLFSLGDLDNIADLCINSPVGKKLRNSLLIHVSALERLDPLLRLYEGCASRTIGRLEDANVIQFHFRKPKISYLVYPDFNTEIHPRLRSKMQISLQNLRVNYQEYDPENPPILHYKYALVTPDYPNYERLAQLTQQEEDWGLLEDLGKVRNLQGWLECLDENYTIIKNYRLSRRKDIDPYTLKVLRARVRTRQDRRRRKNSS